MRVSARVAAAGVLLASAGVTISIAQGTRAFTEPLDHPAIRYSTATLSDPIAKLNQRLADGSATLTFDAESGYLRSTLAALNVPVESQVAVFSSTSLQRSQISPTNPRAIYFNDSVTVGWVRGGSLLEVAAEDPAAGVVFYELEQKPAASTPRFVRNDDCLTCHLTWETFAVPGILVLSTISQPQDKNSYATGFVADHRSPFDQRWGGWFLTGVAPRRHLGKLVDGLDKQFDAHGYLSTHSDVAALMVLEHQTRMTNLMTWLGWEARLASFSGGGSAPAAATNRIRDIARDFVDYLLFVDETPLPGAVKGSSGFAEEFAAAGPADTKGRSLRQLDLTRRLMRYPCSYMIYSEAFDALPPQALDAVYRRMWDVLSGTDRDKRYAVLSLADRRAVVEILKETKKNLPDYFAPVTR